MEASQKERLVGAKNKLHQIHLEAEEKKRLQAEKERIQAKNRAKRAGSRAPIPPIQNVGNLEMKIEGIQEEDVEAGDADGDPIEPTGTESGVNNTTMVDGDDELSEIFFMERSPLFH
ncbi:uncharacterized protein MELLADRAFT_57823 [Melampsora larici-populina 98AG31]|uniref:Uncharacterized protein n=1 Tax=Melampsora larici-populina (strain 98AG31 / pathotype 3-4-7) TaxID=747676 RepID=F4S723_MELLP|nr:uncharacterized protein MELLADRAFT_57823 [Melampsora larici-populina 98AG31]EGF99563.1 hypothetical protein MELLADRAFT_57823 [Melampsora larici-populina 98AG31]